MDMDFVCTFELEYGRMVDFSRIIISQECYSGFCLNLVG